MLMFESHPRAGTVREYRVSREKGSPAWGQHLELQSSMWMLLRLLVAQGWRGQEHSPGLGARDGGMLGGSPSSTAGCRRSPAVFSQGDKGTSWYIIWKGSVNVVTHGKVGASPPDTRCPPAGTRAPTPCHPSRPPLRQGLVATLHEGDDFGQLALVNDAPRAATIILREDSCHFLRVDKQDFNRILKVPGGCRGEWVPVGVWGGTS